MIVARLFARLVAFVVLAALAVAGLAAAVFSIDTGTKGLSLGALARHLDLHRVRDTVGHWLTRMEHGGSVAVIAALCAIAAVLLGLVLLAGAVGRRRERLIVLEHGEQGDLAARRRPLAAIAQTLTEQTHGVTEATARIRSDRTRTAVLRIRATDPTRRDAGETREGVRAQVGELARAFHLRPAIQITRQGRRVQ